MSRIKNWLITKLTEKDGLACVPQTWQEEYVKLAAYKANSSLAFATMMNEYNEMLRDYFNKFSEEELKQEMASSNLPYTEEMTMNDMVEKLYEEFKMTIEKD